MDRNPDQQLESSLQLPNEAAEPLPPTARRRKRRAKAKAPDETVKGLAGAKKAAAPSSVEAIMARLEASKLSERLPPEKLFPYAAFLKTDRNHLEESKLNEIIAVLRFPPGADEATKHAQLLRALDMYESLKPADAAEAMLVIQMIGAHFTAVECRRLASIPGQSLDWVKVFLRYAERNSDLYTRQLAMLDKHRGKGQQKITVERIQIAPGGQAIVGDVHAGLNAPKPPRAAHQPAVLEAPLEDVQPLSLQSERSSVPR